MKTKTPLISHLRKFRKRKGLTQGELAKEAGVNRAYVSDMEGGTRSPSFYIVLQLAKVLGTKPEDLFSLS